MRKLEYIVALEGADDTTVAVWAHSSASGAERAERVARKQYGDAVIEVQAVTEAGPWMENYPLGLVKEIAAKDGDGIGQRVAREELQRRTAARVAKAQATKAANKKAKATA